MRPDACPPNVGAEVEPEGCFQNWLPRQRGEGWESREQLWGIEHKGGLWRLDYKKLRDCVSIVGVGKSHRGRTCLIQLAFCIHGFCICGFNQPQIENIKKKIQESSKKQNLNLPCTGNYLHSIYIVFITIHIAFTCY